MYRILKVNSENGNFTELENVETLNECKTKAISHRIDDEKIVFIYVPNKDEVDFDEKIIETIRENEGNILRVTKGVTVTKNADAICCGPGSCFCVIANGTKQCETQYCNDTICWWVPCGIPCGC